MKKGNIFKKGITILAAAVFLLSMTGCGDDEDETDAAAGSGSVEKSADTESSSDTSWAVYWYLCGSDLESQGGCATTDLQEMLEASLPDNVKVVIETGGAAAWQNEAVSAETLQRYVYDGTDLNLVDEQPSANMGEASTLADFLKFSTENYPADHTMVLFWNHGGGSVTGVAFDELYNYDSLNLSEINEAFSSVWEADATNPAIDMIGFDTCLMATVDTASMCSNYARYMVASEETEPGNGWYYTGWVGALGENPTMDGEELGRTICDSFYEGCQMVGTEDTTTLSLIDLSKISPLAEAYNTFGTNCINSVSEDSSFYVSFARAAGQSENYGGNTKSEGYTNMVDLGDLALQAESALGIDSSAIMGALQDCVLYQINGAYRTQGHGLSCYFPYNNDTSEFETYTSLCGASPLTYFYEYGMTGKMDEAVTTYAEDVDVSNMSAIEDVDSIDWSAMSMNIDDDGIATLTVGPDIANALESISFHLYYMNDEEETLIDLGSDNDIEVDWDNGVFSDNFRGVWGAIDGCLTYMELTYEGDDYNLYTVPILLNDTQTNMMVVYNYTDEAWSILGTRESIDENGMADKDYTLLKDGDKITTLWSLANYDDEEFSYYEADTITYSADTSYGEVDLFDGYYEMYFQMYDVYGNVKQADPVTFQCEDGEIYTILD